MDGANIQAFFQKGKFVRIESMKKSIEVYLTVYKTIIRYSNKRKKATP